ncbi:MAG: rod-binding protein [Thermodesulfobacteriota bacterium]|nr:rod-binding protein [Thermodesulfobacteriota bacterium]
MKLTSPLINDFKGTARSADTVHDKRFSTGAENKKLRQACADFEALLLNKLVSSMRESVPEGGLFEKSFGEKMFQSMHDEELSRQMANGRGTGLGELLYQKLTDR